MLKENVEVLARVEFYHIFIKYLAQIKGKVNVNVPEDVSYYYRILGVCSLFWFACAVMFLDYKSYIEKEFNYLDYSLDRLSIFEYVYNNLL